MNIDKFAWQRPNLEPSTTGIQMACKASSMRKRAEKVEMIAAGNVLAKQQEEMMSKLRIK